MCRGESLPRINSLVDVANLVSLRLQVPVGLYDLAMVRGPLTVRLGREGEAYEDINRWRVTWPTGSASPTTPGSAAIPPRTRLGP